MYFYNSYLKDKQIKKTQMNLLKQTKDKIKMQQKKDTPLGITFISQTW